MKVKIPNAEVQELLAGKNITYPKYSTQLMNLANANAQGTRPKIVGQLSDLIQEFEGKTLEEWTKWYLEKHPNAIKSATDKVWQMIDGLKVSLNQIDRNIVEQWVEDLVVVKTFAGLKFQEAILKKIAAKVKKEYRLATPAEEAKGIDGYIGDTPVSIKPNSYKSKMALNEMIAVSIIYYDKKKDGLSVEFDLA